MGAEGDGRGVVAHRSDCKLRGQLPYLITKCRFIDMTDASALLRLLGDETRLRLLRLLSREALNVSELTGILGAGAVRRLAAPRPAARRGPGRRGARRHVHLVPARARLSGRRRASARRSGPGCARSSTRPTPATRADDARLEEVRRVRKENFDEHGGGDERRQLVPGRSWAAWSRALGLLLPALDVADLGLRRGLPDARGRALGPRA